LEKASLSYAYDHQGRMLERRGEGEGEATRELLLPLK
jgi:hypothetical protein